MGSSAFVSLALQGSRKARGAVAAMAPISGGYPVGVLDVEMPQRNSKPVLFRLYYPTERPTSKPTQWISSYDTALGFMWFLGLPKIIRPPFAWVMYQAFGKKKLPNTSEKPPLLEAKGQEMPAVIFSHGMGANRSSYSALCRSIAADGTIVFALEHRDGSASITFVTDENTGEKKAFPYERLPKDGEPGFEHRIRNNMLNKRVDEVKRVYEAMVALNRGNKVANLADESQEGSDILESLKRKIDMKRVGLAGHSFGAGTVLQAGTDNPNQYSCCLALDPWVFPLTQVMKSSDGPPFRLPLHIIFNEYMNWPDNQRWVGNIAKRSTGEVRTLLLRGASHQIQSDFPVVLGSRLAKAFALSKDGNDEAPFYETMASSLGFLRQTLRPVGALSLNSEENAGLLTTFEFSSDPRSAALVES